MKNLIFLYPFILLNHVLYGQEKKDPLFKGFFKEFGISINQTLFSDPGGGYEYQGITNGTGFGLGAYHTFRKKKLVNLRFGLEFNRIRYFAENQYRGHYCNGYDFSFARNFISMPLGFRLNIGGKTKFFIESGGSFELGIGGYGTGTQICSFPFEPVKTNKINGEGYHFYDLGLYGGLGFRIPVAKHELIAKTDIKVLIGDSHSLYPYYRFVLGFNFK